jgi:drug/metabolite transporter (DMT)-like permease
VCTALAHLLWSKCLSRLEAGTCSLFYPIQPLVSTGLGALWLRERFHTSFFVGGFLILVGVVVSLAEKPAVRIRSQEPAPGPASEALD